MHVQLTLRRETCEAVILWASGNGKSLMLGFKGFMGGYLQMMPLLWDGEAYRDLVESRAVEMETL